MVDSSDESPDADSMDAPSDADSTDEESGTDGAGESSSPNSADGAGESSSPNSADGSGGSAESESESSKSSGSSLFSDEVPQDPDSKREQFWDTICKFAHHFYLLLLMVTFFMVLNLIILALVPASSLDSETRTGSLVVIGINFVILAGTALGIAYVLKRCNEYTSPKS